MHDAQEDAAAGMQAALQTAEAEVQSQRATIADLNALLRSKSDAASQAQRQV
jgi:hypothetical protein